MTQVVMPAQKHFVILAQAGTQCLCLEPTAKALGPGLRRDDDDAMELRACDARAAIVILLAKYTRPCAYRP